MALIEDVSLSDPEATTTLPAVLKKVELARRKIAAGEICTGVSQADVRAIVASFNTTDHILGYLALSTVVSFLRENCNKDNVPTEAQTELIASLFYPSVDAGMRATDTEEMIHVIDFGGVLLQCDAQVGAHIFLRDGVRQWLAEIPELYPIPQYKILWRRTTIYLSLACGVSSCRPIIRQTFGAWLQQSSRTSGDLMTRSSAAVALTKLSRAVGDAASPEGGMWKTGIPDEQESAAEARQRAAQDVELTNLMKSLIISESGAKEEDSSPVLDAVEGLAYLSAEPSIKKSLAEDDTFLEHLFSLIPTARKHNNLIARHIDDAPTAKTSTALAYGVSVIISNLVTYAPRLTEEESQMDKLRRMARPGAASSSGHLQDPDEVEAQQRESDDIVAVRGKKLIKAGLLPVLVGLLKSAETGSVRISIARSYLALIEDKDNRGLVLQNGGAKALAYLSRAGGLPMMGMTPQPLFTADRKADFARRQPVDLIPIQALAKLAITTRPQLVFGTQEGEMSDAIPPFHMLLLHPDASLLQKFEAMMALTNLASVSPSLANKVATNELAMKLEILMLDDNIMVRRAAVELVCNTITTESMLPRYGGVPSSDELTAEKAYMEAKPVPATVSRVHVLLGLSDVEDIKTQLAASGALATLLSITPAAVKALLSIKKGPSGVFAILSDIVDPGRIVEVSEDKEEARQPAVPNDPGELLQLAHRGVVCIWSILSVASALGMEAAVVKAADEEKTAGALVKLIKPLMAGEARNTPGPRQIIMTSAQALKWLNDRGIEVKT